MPKLPAIGVPTPVDTGEVVSLPAATPTTPPAGTVVVSAVRPEHVGDAVGQHVAGDNRALDHAVGVGLAVGTSSMMLTVMVPVAVLPLASVTW